MSMRSSTERTGFEHFVSDGFGAEPFGADDEGGEANEDECDLKGFAVHEARENYGDPGASHGRKDNEENDEERGDGVEMPRLAMDETVSGEERSDEKYEGPGG